MVSEKLKLFNLKAEWFPDGMMNKVGSIGAVIGWNPNVSNLFSKCFWLAYLSRRDDIKEDIFGDDTNFTNSLATKFQTAVNSDDT